MLLLASADFLKKNLRNTMRVSNSLDTDQYQLSVDPDLDPSCLQSYQQMTKVAVSKEELMKI